MADFDASFPFARDVFLSDAPMTDAEFEEFVRLENGEIPVEKVDFSKSLYTIFEI